MEKQKFISDEVVSVNRDEIKNKLLDVCLNNSEQLDTPMIKKLIERSTAVTGRLMDGVKLNKPTVDVLFETWEASSSEIKNLKSLITTKGFVAKDFEFSKFIFHGDLRKEHVALKAAMLIGQMKQHHDNLETHCH